MKSFKKMSIIIISIILLLGIVVIIILQHPQFGKAPSGERLERMKMSPRYKDGHFENAIYTPQITEGYSMWSVMYDFLFKKFPNTNPKDLIPSIKNDLHSIPINDDILVWFGHSSYYIQLGGIRYLVDPVFSGNASPIPNSNKSFPGTDIYNVDDIPEIDYLLITHDHYDHLDYKTIIALNPKVKKVICGLGVGSHLEYWDYDVAKIAELDWNDSIAINPSTMLFAAPARHFSGRSIKRNNTLWMSFVLITNDYKLYLGGDSGYDDHFKTIGDRFSGFDLALLDNGQYNIAWQAIHMLPEEGLKAARDLQTKRLFPVHSSKFKLANHPWDEPLRRIHHANDTATEKIPIISPKIGEIIYLRDSTQSFTKWWEEME